MKRRDELVEQIEAARSIICCLLQDRTVGNADLAIVARGLGYSSKYFEENPDGGFLRTTPLTVESLTFLADAMDDWATELEVVHG